MPGGPDMRHHVDIPYPLPILVGHFHATNRQDSGIGNEKVDRANFGFNAFDQRSDVFFAPDVDFYRCAIDLIGRLRCATQVKISAHDMFGAFACETDGQRAANPARGAGDDHDLVFQVHICLLRPTYWSRHTPSAPDR